MGKQLVELSEKYPEWFETYSNKRGGGITRKKKVNSRKNRTYKY